MAQPLFTTTIIPLRIKTFFLCLGMVMALSVGSLSFAVDSRPQIPEAGEDLKLTKGIPVAQFFADRLENKDCQKDLQLAQESHRAENKRLNQLVAEKANASVIDEAEEKLRTSRLLLLAKVQTCGVCAANELKKVTVTTAKREYWYLTDGSCFVGNGRTPESLDKIYEKTVNRLRNIKQYSHKNGGFKPIIEFSEIDVKTGQLLPPVEKVVQSPLHTFVGIQGPEALGVTVGFWYLFKSDLIETQKENLKEFIIRSESIKGKPFPFSNPQLKITSASGRALPVLQKELSLVQGLWYVNNRGYFRYYTAADFGLNIPFGNDFATNTLLEMIYSLTEDAIADD